ncbi:MAG: glutathione peroxidase [Tateyamaria sp.]|nr:glutathione peroxidase [Tateyamaria sp.]MDG1421518.1 glutathione peroxidase [Tateyamaria sp.]MDG1679835.1 glutathione peroxidase [Tateyamaria sp.]
MIKSNLSMLTNAAAGLGFFISLFSPTTVGAKELSFHSFPSIDGGFVDTSQWQGKPYLVINTASRCGFTKQYAGMQELYNKYRDQGLGMIAVPSNDFNQELSSNAEVKNFCELNFGIDMPMSETISVKGQNAHLFYKDVREQSGFVPKWNFNKILIGVDGKVAGTWGSLTKPLALDLVRAIEQELALSQ